jgi:hypothetical protein
MNQEKNHWLALYLSGKYPGNYRLPNRFDVILKIRQLDGVNFSDAMLSLLKDKGDIEFYNSLFSTFESLHSPENYEKLLARLEIPKNILRDPFEKEEITKSGKLPKSIGFLTPYDGNKDTKEEMIKSILPTDWKFESFDLKTFVDKDFLWEQVKQFLEKHAFYVVDLRPKKEEKEKSKTFNENVLLELGYILAKGKKLILIKREGLQIPSDLRGIPYVEEKMIPQSETKESDKDELKTVLETEIIKAISEF